MRLFKEHNRKANNLNNIILKYRLQKNGIKQ